MANNKDRALEFLRLVTSGKIEEAYENHVDMNGKHHNMYFPAGFPTLKQAMIDNEKEFPNKTMSVKHAVADGDMVAVHSRVVLKPGEMDIAVVHLLRFAGGKIVEMWDVGVQIPKEMPNTDGVF